MVAIISSSKVKDAKDPQGGYSKFGGVWFGGKKIGIPFYIQIAPESGTVFHPLYLWDLLPYFTCERDLNNLECFIYLSLAMDTTSLALYGFPPDLAFNYPWTLLSLTVFFPDRKVKLNY